MLTKNRLLAPTLCLDLLASLTEVPYAYLYQAERHRLVFTDPHTGHEVAHVRLPIQMHLSGEEVEHFLLVLVQSGAAAVGCFNAHHCLDHKVFKSYMVRKKQGKSQIKYLNTKGKSKAGSRVRLANAVQFFENVNMRVQECDESFAPERVAWACSKTLIPYLYDAHPPFPFAKDDPRLMKIPKHIPVPNYEVLLSTHQFLTKGEIHWDAENEEVLVNLLGA
jgi:hypothetical protein